MGQKANPIGNRLGIIRGWESNWFGGANLAQKLVEDKNTQLPPGKDPKRRYC